jgi:TIR domain-containing protein
MSFVPGFEFDIFISYAHNDNTPIGASPGWVDEFQESLENWLGKRRGIAGLKVWRDTRIDGNTDFDLAIQNRLKSSALLFVLHSRNYAASAYCLKELRYFYESCRAQPAGVRVQERLRILNILLNNIAHQTWPDELKVFGAESGFPMHDAKSDDERGDLTSFSSTLFEAQLRKIVDAAEATLRDFAKAAQAPVPVPDPTEPRPVRVFLAHVAEALEPIRDRLIADLAGHAEVLAGIPPPGESVSHRQRVEQALDGTDVSLHLLDQSPGRAIVDDARRSYPREQVDIAMSKALPKLIWVPDDLETDAITDVGQREFLKGLENGERGTKNYEFVRCNRVALSDILLQKISAITDQLLPTNLTFLVDTHQKDQRYAYKLADLLADQGVDVAFNRESVDPSESLANFQRAVMTVRNLIVMYGRVGEAWLKRRIQVALKVVAEQFQSESPSNLQAIWICLLPESASPVALRMPTGILRINLLDNTRSDAIEPTIVTQLLGGK